MPATQTPQQIVVVGNKAPLGTQVHWVGLHNVANRFLNLLGAQGFLRGSCHLVRNYLGRSNPIARPNCLCVVPSLSLSLSLSHSLSVSASPSLHLSLSRLLMAGIITCSFNTAAFGLFGGGDGDNGDDFRNSNDARRSAIHPHTILCGTQVPLKAR